MNLNEAIIAWDYLANKTNRQNNSKQLSDIIDKMITIIDKDLDLKLEELSQPKPTKKTKPTPQQ